MADDDLVALATRELAAIGLVEPTEVERGYVVRMPKAYPVYDDTYRDAVETIAPLAGRPRCPTCTPWAATGCTSTTTRTTRCTRPC